MNVWYHTDGKVYEIMGDLFGIDAHVPLANIRAKYEAFVRYGGYDRRRA